MKLNKYITGFLIGISGAIVVSCSDFLDELPDSRAELNNPSSIKKLLVTGYANANYAVVAELSGDNVIDSNSPNYDVEEDQPSWGKRNNFAAFTRMDNELFAWENLIQNDQESPYVLWEAYYKAIAVANQALEAIEKMRNAGNLSSDDLATLNGAEAEALLIRSYHHFLLVNIFAPAYRDEQLSSDLNTALGIPYVKKPETTVHVNYERLSVAEVYSKIGRDLEAALKLLNDGAIISTNEDVQKYHFSKQSANAFAARYYLFIRDYDKVIAHATAALGDNPASQMRDFMKFDGLITPESQSLEWANTASPSNYMLMSTNSTIMRRFATTYRYLCNRKAASGSLASFGPTWSLSPHASFMLTQTGNVAGNADYGWVTYKAVEIFQYIDKMAGTGYAHTIRREFTAEETLLCRAEAYIYKGDLDAALADLSVWDASRQNVPESYKTQYNFPKALTHQNLTEFYGNQHKNEEEYAPVLHTTEMSPSFVVQDSWLPYIHCVLHYRRLETIFEGNRWFDLKRYGIEVVHAIGKDKVDTLKWNDPRRAIQIPQEAIFAGMQPNNR